MTAIIGKFVFSEDYEDILAAIAGRICPERSDEIISNLRNAIAKVQDGWKNGLKLRYDNEDFTVFLFAAEDSEEHQIVVYKELSCMRFTSDSKLIIAGVS